MLLKITVPKRTGRKRKRGSNDPFIEEIVHSTVPASQGFGITATGMNESGPTPEAHTIRSQERADDPLHILEVLQDNVNNYSVGHSVL